MLKIPNGQLILKVLGTLNEAQSRWYVAKEAIFLGRGGITAMHELTGMSRTTITRGKNELQNQDSLGYDGRIRKPGGGRKSLESKNPKLKTTIEEILDENTAGDPMSFLKWTNKSTYVIAEELSRMVCPTSAEWVRRKLNKLGYSLQSNQKSKEGKHSKERDDQFRYINKQFKEFSERGQPGISVDAKKKELIGEFKNLGKTWRKKGQPEKVNVYDYPSLADGKAIPYGTYDVARNEGFVNVGISNNTAKFAVESIRQWWYQLGKKRYPNAKELLISADAGGSNGYRNRLWKHGLQQLANETGLKITVVHLPPGTSKWNKIEHRLFSFISKNWRGKPLISYEVIINLINATKTSKGLEVYARLDKKQYKKGVKISDKQMEELNIEKHSLHPDWNYTISSNI